MAPLAARDAVAVVELTTQLERCVHVVQSVAASVVASAGTWRGHGDRSKEEWLARTTGTTTGVATGLFATGAALADLPKVADAARRGALSPAQLNEIAGAATVAPEAQDRLLLQAERGSLAELREACKRTRAAADPDPEATHQRIHRNRAARRHDQADGTAVITISGTSDQIGRMWAHAQHRADQVFRRAHKEGRREPVEAYLVDAIDELLARDGASDDGGRPLPVGAKAKIIFRVDWAAATRGFVEDDEICEIVGVGPVPVSVVREAAKDAFISAVVTKGTDIRLVTHLGRHPTALQETYLQWAMPSCVVAGCTRTVRLETHHAVEWNLTHITHVDFLEPRCKHHHDLETYEGWTLGPPQADGKRPLVRPASVSDPSGYVREADGTVAELTDALHQAVETIQRDRRRSLQPA